MGSEYYTPSREDFHIGFEYELWSNLFGWEEKVLRINERDYGDFSYLYRALEGRKWEDMIRVKCLTDDQIVREGWLFSGNLTSETVFRKFSPTSFFNLYYSADKHRVVIEEIHKTTPEVKTVIYSGRCMHINELRIIIKFVIPRPC